MAVKSYNPNKVMWIVGGIPASGFADGTFISIEALTDGVSSQSGADGEIARAVSTDVRHRVTVTLQQTSDTNKVYSGYLAADRASGGGVLLPYLMEDLSGGATFAGAQCWIVKEPTRAYSKGIETREWVFETGEPTINII